MLTTGSRAVFNNYYFFEQLPNNYTLIMEQKSGDIFYEKATDNSSVLCPFVIHQARKEVKL